MASVRPPCARVETAVTSTFRAPRWCVALISMPTTTRPRPACRAAPSDPMVSASTQEAPPCSRPNGWVLPATGIVATTSAPDADRILMPIRCARVPSAVVTATILSSISWFIRTSSSRSLGPCQGCHGPGGRHKSGTRSHVPARIATLTASNSVTVWSYRGDFGLVSAHNSGWNLFMKGAHYARDRKTATSPSPGHHGASPHGGDRGRGIPSSHPGQRREQRIDIILERPLQQQSHSYGRTLRLTCAGHPVQQHAGADVQVD